MTVGGTTVVVAGAGVAAVTGVLVATVSVDALHPVATMSAITTANNLSLTVRKPRLPPFFKAPQLLNPVRRVSALIPIRDPGSGF